MATTATSAQSHNAFAPPPTLETDLSFLTTLSAEHFAAFCSAARELVSQASPYQLPFGERDIASRHGSFTPPSHPLAACTNEGVHRIALPPHPPPISAAPQA
jgi:hypothetical protein